MATSISNPATRMQLALTLEEVGQKEAALVQYTRALQDAQIQGQWLNPQTTPPALRAVVEHAVRRVRQGRRDKFASLLEPLAQRHGHSAVLRIRQALRIYLKEEAPVYPDPRQRPSFLFFPGLPAAPYLERSLFPWIEDLEARSSDIREELEQLLLSPSGRERVFTQEAVERQNLRGLNAPPEWNGYYFYRYGQRHEDNCTRCPMTAAVLDALPLVHIREHAPEVMFSVFSPGTHLLPHRGVTNTRVVAHLPLIIPSDCALSVGGEVHHWQEGRVVVFDDTYEHEAWNRSGERRVVLIFDIWNPHLTEVERLGLKELTEAIGDFRKAVEAA